MKDAPSTVVPEPGLYRSTVMHARLVEPRHRFTYRVFSLFVDLDALGSLGAGCPFFSIDRPNLVSFRQSDHGDRDGTPLRAFVDRHLDEAGAAPARRVMLLCFPRIFGYVFNPISVYYCYGEDGAIGAMIYEVGNTFGESHTYVVPVSRHENRELIRHERNKVFYVSPFLGMDKRYHFRVQPPGDTLRFRIFETDRNGPVLSATQAGTWSPLTTAVLAGALLSMPFSAFKVIAGIHFEAVRLWLRGARYHRRDTPPPPVSYHDEPTMSDTGR